MIWRARIRITQVDADAASPHAANEALWEDEDIADHQPSAFFQDIGDIDAEDADRARQIALRVARKVFPASDIHVMHVGKAQPTWPPADWGKFKAQAIAPRRRRG